ncbi:MAG: DUF2167 domain-containing protein [Verrucomicrobiae bacterium]|nr:DUF2167 domain-containing protein [Verrucomicrobiae bacterium]
MKAIRPLPFIVATSVVFSISSLQAQDKPAAEQEMSEEEAQKAFMEHVESLGWQRDGVGSLKSEAEIQIPEGYRFTGTDGTQKLMTAFGNLKTDREYGMIAPEDLDWFVVFEFDKSGYVKDDEKAEINDAFAAKMLKSMKENDGPANEQRKEMGYPALYTRGWARPPFYNEETNNLEWALDLESEGGGHTVNFNTRLLGRYGVMEAVLVCDPEKLDAVLPEFQKLIAGFQYQGGHTYAEYKSGDKVAKYGLTALILGGGAAVAAKTGLFAGLFKIFGKLGKAAYLLVAGLVAGVVNAFKRLFGRHTE